MTGKILKGIAGFYYVYAAGSGIYECKAKGIFRKEKIKPLVGDLVEIEILDEKDMEANIVEILPRNNELIRPAVSNVDQAMVVFALAEPKPNNAVLDQFLLMMEKQDISVMICFNKTDLVSKETASHWMSVYERCGYRVHMISATEGIGIEALKQELQGKTTVLAGPSGAGKSTLTNHLQDEVSMETGTISKKLGRGRHTTRHSQLIPLKDGGWLCDTPGFTSLYTADVPKEELSFLFPEFLPYLGQCRFQPCMHIHEPDCRVREALSEGKISPERYNNYVMFFEEIKDKEKRRY